MIEKNGSQNPKTLGLKFPILRKFEVKIPIRKSQGFKGLKQIIYRNDPLGAPDFTASFTHLCPEMHLSLNWGTLYKTDLFVIFI